MVTTCDICATWPGHQKWCPRAEGDKPLLGLATTRELLEEIIARAEVDKLQWAEGLCRTILFEASEDFLSYRTVDKS